MKKVKVARETEVLITATSNKDLPNGAYLGYFTDYSGNKLLKIMVKSSGNNWVVMSANDGYTYVPSDSISLEKLTITAKLEDSDFT